MIRSGLFGWGLPSTQNYSRRASNVERDFYALVRTPCSWKLLSCDTLHLLTLSHERTYPYTSETHILIILLLMNSTRLTISDNIQQHSLHSSNHRPPNPTSQCSLDAPRPHQPPHLPPRMRSSLLPLPCPLRPLRRPLPRRHRHIPRVNCVLVRHHAAEQRLLLGKARCRGS
jgi:hypothetical protein